jgi:electron transfer flavoprotein beta subunit
MPDVILACVQPAPLGEPQVSKGVLVTEGQAWGLPPTERGVMSAAMVASKALGGQVVAASIAPRGSEAGLREALALGAARAVLLETQQADAAHAARTLASLARALSPRLVIAGEAGFDGHGAVGAMLAELLGFEMLGGVTRLEAREGILRGRRPARANDELFEVEPPALLTVSARFAPKLHVTSWGAGEAFARPLTIQPAPSEENVLRVLSLARGEPPRGEAERIEGDADEAAAQLARRLRAPGVLR